MSPDAYHGVPRDNIASATLALDKQLRRKKPAARQIPPGTIRQLPDLSGNPAYRPLRNAIGSRVAAADGCDFPSLRSSSTS